MSRRRLAIFADREDEESEDRIADSGMGFSEFGTTQEI